MVPRVLAPHIKTRKAPAHLRVGSVEGVSLILKACSFSLHFLCLNDMFLKENLRRSRMKAFLTDSALDSFICRARFLKTSSTSMSFLAEVSKNGQEKLAAIFFPSS